MKLQIILSNQLFQTKFYKKTPDIVFMCEDLDLFNQFNYHKHRLIFFLASMRRFSNELKTKGYKVNYYKLNKKIGFFGYLKTLCNKQNVKVISVYEIENKYLENKIVNFCKKYNIKLEILKTPMFILTRDYFKKFAESKKKLSMRKFYEDIRKEKDILMEKNGRPVGGKYSFDKENRKKIPKNFDIIKSNIRQRSNKFLNEVIRDVEKYFKSNPGSTSGFWLATSRNEALKELKIFINNKFHLFGDFEDAIDHRDPFLYHSILSPYLNIGLLTPEEIVKKALEADVNINSKEGFIRQIIGWREFVRGFYQGYSELQERNNFFKHRRKLKNNWYDGSTGILPLDDAIKKVLKFGYNHHIERLMIISNLMLLCQICPREVNKWFMEMYVDSDEWVMGPNVYGMGQFSDGGIFATKPYISGSNYILKMSSYKKGEWCDIWDGLYWSFIDYNKDFFKKNRRMNMMVNLVEKMDKDKKNALFKKANKFKKEVTY